MSPVLRLKEDWEVEVSYLCFGDIFRRPYPIDLITKLLNGIYQTPNVAGDIVQQVHRGHLARRSLSGVIALQVCMYARS